MLRTTHTCGLLGLCRGLAKHQPRLRGLSAAAAEASAPAPTQKLRNIGISAHIDSGKTTLTERILYFTGRIGSIHEVRGKDGVGATMDSMDLEREKGITIQSAATHCAWGDHEVNIIDTPGHVDFTIEVERALRVLDGAVLVLCGVAGVQSQSITVDRQMRRYSVPRVAFINKLDREGSNPDAVIEQLRAKLRQNAAAVQLPIGLSGDHEGVVDLVEPRAFYFDGEKGEKVRVESVPAALREQVAAKRLELIERLADVDDEMAEFFISEESPPTEVLRAAIRRATIANAFVPVYMGSAYKNKGVQPLLDGVVDYLPSPREVTNVALDLANEEAEVKLTGASEDPFVGLAFKLEEGRFGQLTYIRVYQGTVRRGDTIYAMTSEGKKVRVPKLVRMHSNEMQDVDAGSAGDIVAVFGVDCASGTTFTDGATKSSMTSMFVPDPVVSLSLQAKQKNHPNFSKALNRFNKEDPTFRVHADAESGETIISGMGELHLEIYVERLKREYNCECVTGAPKVAFREAPSRRAEFDYTHKKQSGGSGQYGKVIGYIEPVSDQLGEGGFDFENALSGNAIPPEFVTSIAKGFKEALEKGDQVGYPVQGVRVVLQDGLAHQVDSNDLSFRAAARGAFRQAMRKAAPVVLEPLMASELSVPSEFQGAVVGLVSQRKGQINSMEGADFVTIDADVPLANMFGFSSDLRSATQGKGEFSMEYKTHVTVPRDKTEEMKEAYQKNKKAEDDD